jgi:hypothetical protein
LGLLWVLPLAASDAPRVYEIPKIDDEIRVDAVLDEPAWEHAVQIEAPYENSPGYNVPAKVRTVCLLMHDSTHLYAAFRAYDPEPHKIRAHLTDRDPPFGNDDMVGITLDTFNDQRRAASVALNPLGVQRDEVVDEVNDSFDPSWDAIWESTGRLTDEGYVVEVAIPFSQLRFRKTAGAQTWGINVFRFRPRDRGYINRSQPVDRDIDCLICQFSKIHGFAGVEPGLNLELDPTFTAVRSEQREEIDDLLETTEEVEIGLTAAWGFRPNMVFTATINPDFSHVEADVAQLGINQRFSLFFPEKRPFFLEGRDYFNTPINAVYTRTMVDPSWGLKLTGKEGRNAFGVYAVEDNVTGLVFPSQESSDSELFDQGNRTGIFRYRRDVGRNSTLGALVTGRTGEEYSNQLYGLDGTLRFTQSDTVRFQALASKTEYPEDVREEYGQPAGSLDDTALSVNYEHTTEDWDWGLFYDDLGNDFRADSGFVPRVGVRLTHATVGRIWHGDEHNWYSQTRVGVVWEYTEDQDGNLLEREFEVGWEFRGGMRSRTFVGLGHADEVFEGMLFPDQQSVQFTGGFWPSSDLQLRIVGMAGDQVDYDNGRSGEQVTVAPGLTWRIGIHWSVDFDHEYQRLDVDAGRLFTANLSQARVIYHLNIRTFVRAIVQYTQIDHDPRLYDDEVEARETRLFSQLLFSYKLNARTVVFVGYSEGTDGNDDFHKVLMNRSVFVKLGYAWLL